MILAIVTISLMAGLFGLVLGYAAIRFKVDGNPVVDQINALLPQTQCGQCTYPGCRPYAEAIANGEAPINQCPPGGQATIVALADLLDTELLELNTEHGEHLEVAHMHTVIADECTGCKLCLPPCPVDCIDMLPAPQTIEDWKWAPPRPLEPARNA